MLFCRDCGQCKYISDDNFIEYAEISGTETRYIDPDTYEINDYGDSNTEGSGSSTYECPHCSSDNIEFDSSVTEIEVFEVRAEYEDSRKKRREFLKKEEQKAMVGSSDWDLTAN